MTNAPTDDSLDAEIEDSGGGGGSFLEPPDGDAPADYPRVEFHHSFFSRVDDLYFRLDEHSGDPIAVVCLGEEKLALPFPGIRREFSLEETDDGRMLDTVGKALKYVKILRIGDVVPAEIIDRKASWNIGPQHRQIAYHRLALQMISWLAGDEHIITETEEILQVAGDPTFRKKVNEAFAEAAEALGLGRENREQVVRFISELANELAYIEALRDHFVSMQRMEAKIQDLRRLYGSSRTVQEIVDPVAKLMRRAVVSFQELFEQADAQTGEVMAALRNIEAQKTFIQDMRDQLYIRYIPWEEILAAWERLPPKISQEAESLLGRTYRFLAPRYMPVDEWQMMTKLQMNVIVGGKAGIAQKAVRKKLGGSMKWF